jgi:hypothetical protein
MTGEISNNCELGGRSGHKIRKQSLTVLILVQVEKHIVQTLRIVVAEPVLTQLQNTGYSITAQS